MTASVFAMLICLNTWLTPSIDVVYPRVMEGDTICYISQVDSNFIFGSVKPASSGLSINGIPVDLQANGSFLAFLPVDWNTRTYLVQAFHNGDTTLHYVDFTVRESPPVSELASDITFPRVISLIGRVARTDPEGAYYIFPEPETQCLATGWDAGYFELPLGGARVAWIDERYVSEITDVEYLPEPVLWKASVSDVDGRVEVRVPVGRKLLYRVWDDPDQECIYIDLYNSISHIDRIRYGADISPVKEVTWDQSASGIVTIKVSLSETSWGYKPSWDEGDFVLTIKKRPDFRRGIKGLKIALDPGHGGSQHGAIGPTGLKEKDANLKLALELARLLERKGAEVILTRTEDVDLGLGRRITIAEEANADILISLHHNALPDGVNPFSVRGTGTHYYHPQSRELANYIQREVVGMLDIPDEGIYYHNLALVRPTAMPSVLLEAAYIMLPEQEMLMLRDDYNKKLAGAIYRGIKEFVMARKKSSK